jgi:hypothetical protein
VPRLRMPMLPIFLVLGVLALLTVAGPMLAHEGHGTATPGTGTPGAGTPGAGTPSAGTPELATPTLTGTDVAIPDAAMPVVMMVTAQAAAKLGVPENQLQVTRVEAVEWPDSSLGCPEQGEFYAQVITPGYLIEVAAGGETLEYHTDATGSVIKLCD